VESETKEISIQADNNAVSIKKRRVRKVEKQSVGVGSLCIDETIQKKPKVKRRKVVDLSRASIAT